MNLKKVKVTLVVRSSETWKQRSEGPAAVLIRRRLRPRCIIEMETNIFLRINIFVWLVCFHSGKCEQTGEH